MSALLMQAVCQPFHCSCSLKPVILYSLWILVFTYCCPVSVLALRTAFALSLSGTNLPYDLVIQYEI